MTTLTRTTVAALAAAAGVALLAALAPAVSAESQPVADSTRLAFQPLDPTGNVLLRKGRFTSLPDVPGAAATLYAGLNDRGQAVGGYEDADGLHGFVRDRNGRVRTIEPRGAQITIVYDINNRGQMVGTYVEKGAVPTPDGFFPRGTQHAFLWEKGKVRIIDPPDTVYAPNAYGINDRGQIVGVRLFADKRQFGYVRNPDGTYTSLDPPGADENKPLGIDDRGRVVGGYLDDGAVPNPAGLFPAGTLHGFVWDGRRYTRLDVPGSRATAAWRIDSRGRILGEVKDRAGAIHGFVLERGRYTILDHPRSTTDSIALDGTKRGDILVQSPRRFGVLQIVE